MPVWLYSCWHGQTRALIVISACTLAEQGITMLCLITAPVALVNLLTLLPLWLQMLGRVPFHASKGLAMLSLRAGNVVAKG